MTSIFMATLNKVCGAHDGGTWSDEKHSQGWNKFPFEYYYIPEEPYDQVDVTDFQGW